MQSFVEIIILLVFLCYHNLKIRLSVIRKDPLLSVFDFLGHIDPHFQEIRYFLCLSKLWRLLFFKFGKSSDKCHCR